MRTDEYWRFDAAHITQSSNKNRADELCIHGESILMRLTLIDFPRSFVLDSMHLFYLNAILGIFNYTWGNFFQNDHNDSDPAIPDSTSQTTPIFRTPQAAQPHLEHEDDTLDTIIVATYSTRLIADYVDSAAATGEDSDISDLRECETSAPERTKNSRNPLTTFPLNPNLIPPGPTKSCQEPPQKAARKTPKFIQSKDPFCLSPATWTRIGQDINSSALTYPAEFGDQIRSIIEACHQYKAHECVRGDAKVNTNTAWVWIELVAAKVVSNRRNQRKYKQ